MMCLCNLSIFFQLRYARKLPPQVDSSKVEFSLREIAHGTQLGASFPVRHGDVLHCNFEAIGA